MQNTSGNAKAAVMIRESLDPGSRQALADVEPSAGIEFLYRTNTGGTTTGTTVTGEAAPNWVRLTRTNNVFTAYWSPDGLNWNQIGTTNLPMTNISAYAGLAVCSHNKGVLNTSLLANVTASFLPNAAPALAAISNQTVNVGQTVAVTAGATTPPPPPTLTFSLLNGPVNATLASLNGTNAAFSWRPGVGSAGTTNPVTLAVAENGWPVLSATQSFTVVVNPLTLPTMPSSGWHNGRFTLVVSNNFTGPDYTVLGSSNLLNWYTLFSTNSPPTNVFQWTDPNALPLEFYRIQMGPP